MTFMMTTKIKEASIAMGMVVMGVISIVKMGTGLASMEMTVTKTMGKVGKVTAATGW